MNATTPTKSTVYFRYQSHSVPFDQWISMLTVCLAPLVTHIVFGFAEPVLLSDRPPRWTDRLAQFNPITIIWRWYAIVYRRVRARARDRADMAASNAIFWNGSRWNGSEEMMLRSRNWVTKLPKKSRVAFISPSTLATVAMTLQGAGAITYIVQTGTSNWRAPGLALPNIFYPIAVLSFARLPASIWLSSRYGYDTSRKKKQCQTFKSSPEIKYDHVEPRYHLDCASELGDWSRVFQPSQTVRPAAAESRLKPPSTLGARLCTVIALLMTCFGCGGCAYVSVLAAGPRPFVIITGASSLVLRMLYFTLSVSGLCIFVFYILKGEASNTVVPCMNSLWYKGLNILIISLALTAFILSALETRIGPDGQATTYSIPPT